MAKVESGFPHSEIQGSKPVRGSPRLIAAYHVLHRLSAPRHPPDTLMTLDRSHYRCPLLGRNGHRRGTSSQNEVFKTFASKHVRDDRRSSLSSHGSPSARTASASLRWPRGPTFRPDTFTLHDVEQLACPEGKRRQTLQRRRCASRINRWRIPYADGLKAGHLGSTVPAPLISDICRPISETGGARRDRTDDLMLAKHALSQLSYCPILGQCPRQEARRPVGLADAGASVRRSRPALTGGPGKTRTSDLTLIKRAL
jgi:hypothetical protein